MKRIIYLGILILAALCTSTVSAQDMKARTSPDSQFMTMLASANSNEMVISQTTLIRSKNADIKQFAQTMIEDHKAAGNELKTLATGKKVTLPKTMDAKHTALNSKLSNLSDNALDIEYIKAMVKDHEAAVSLLQKEADSGKDDEAKAFAAKILPTVKGHLDMARDLMNKVSNKIANSKAVGKK